MAVTIKEPVETPILQSEDVNPDPVETQWAPVDGSEVEEICIFVSDGVYKYIPKP